MPQAAAILVRERPAAILTTGGYVALPVVLAAAPLRIPVVLWEGNAIPGRSVRAIARLADAIAVSYDAAGRALAGTGVPTYVTGTPIRDVSAITRAAGSRAARSATRRADDPDLRRVPGRPPVQRRGRGGPAATRRARPRPPREWRVGVRGGAGRRASSCRPTVAAATGRTRSCATTCWPRSSRPTSSSGGPGSSTVAEVTALGIPSVIVPYPHASGHQGANAGILAEAGAARIVPDEDFDADALVAAADILFDESVRSVDGRRGAAVRPTRRGRRDRGPRPRARRPQAAPDAGGDRGDRARGRQRDRRPGYGRAAVRPARDRDRDPAPDRGQDVPRRAARPVHDDARRRPGGPVRDRPQHPRAAGDRPVRPHPRDPADPARAGERRRHRRRRDPRPRRPEPGRGIADRRATATSRSPACRWPGRRPRRRTPD